MKYGEVLLILYQKYSLTSKDLAYLKDISRRHASTDLLRLYKMNLAKRSKQPDKSYLYEINNRGINHLKQLEDQILEAYFDLIDRGGICSLASLPKDAFDYIMDQYRKKRFMNPRYP